MPDDQSGVPTRKVVRRFGKILPSDMGKLSKVAAKAIGIGIIGVAPPVVTVYVVGKLLTSEPASEFLKHAPPAIVAWLALLFLLIESVRALKRRWITAKEEVEIRG